MSRYLRAFTEYFTSPLLLSSSKNGTFKNKIGNERIRTRRQHKASEKNLCVRCENNTFKYHNTGKYLTVIYSMSFQVLCGPGVAWWFEHRTPDRKAWVRCLMPPNTFRVHTEYVLVKSVGPKVLWAESQVKGTGEYFPPL
ncbi:hypothetical protein TNCV_3565071 [Trichonephila clavipes]|nr:hypothetical protein TNCV_3565071 [Trichonephila clavipes]